MGFWGHGGLYSDWCDYLDRWAEAACASDERPPALNQTDFDSQTWVRLAMRIQEAVVTKLDRWSESFGRSMSRTSDEFTLGQALAQSREGLRSILVLSTMSELPELLRGQLRKQIDGTINDAQSQLLDQAHRDLQAGPASRSLAEIKIRQIRANPLTAVISQSTPATTPFALPPITSTGIGGRKILFDRIGDP